jgi:hypothetical protein
MRASEPPCAETKAAIGPSELARVNPHCRNAIEIPPKVLPRRFLAQNGKRAQPNRNRMAQAPAVRQELGMREGNKCQQGNAGMTGIWAESAQRFLLILAATTTLFFAIPIFVAPLKWAKLMLWRVPADTDLAIYFGRCLGAFILIVEILAFRAGLNGTGLLFSFQVFMMVWLFMIAVHVWGWFKGIQPITETLEIGLWIVLLLLTLAFWPAQ